MQPQLELDRSKVPDFAPISINLDLTTACNYACDHCVDLDILNTGIRFDHDKLLASTGGHGRARHEVGDRYRRRRANPLPQVRQKRFAS